MFHNLFWTDDCYACCGVEMPPVLGSHAVYAYGCVCVYMRPHVLPYEYMGFGVCVCLSEFVHVYEYKQHNQTLCSYIINNNRREMFQLSVSCIEWNCITSLVSSVALTQCAAISSCFHFRNDTTLRIYSSGNLMYVHRANCSFSTYCEIRQSEINIWTLAPHAEFRLKQWTETMKYREPKASDRSWEIAILLSTNRYRVAYYLSWGYEWNHRTVTSETAILNINNSY